MAQFDFYGSWEDSRTYLEKLIHQQRFTFVIDMWYTERVPFLFKTLTEDTENVLQKHSRVYLWSDDYSHFPPGFGEPNSTGQMMIRPTEGGPALYLTFPHCFKHNGRFQLGSGMLFYQPTYHNPETGEWYKPPEALKRAYKDVRALLRKAMVKRYIRSQTVTTEGVIKPIIMPLWIGSDAIRLLETGMVEILFGRDDWRTGKDLVKTRSELEPLVDEYA